jgi:hypothetical protein
MLKYPNPLLSKAHHFNHFKMVEARMASLNFFPGIGITNTTPLQLNFGSLCILALSRKKNSAELNHPTNKLLKGLVYKTHTSTWNW